MVEDVALKVCHIEVLVVIVIIGVLPIIVIICGGGGHRVGIHIIRNIACINCSCQIKPSSLGKIDIGRTVNGKTVIAATLVVGVYGNIGRGF